jgi:hypothetical protein
VLPIKVYDAPTAIALLYVLHRKRRDLGSSQSTAEKHGNYCAVAQALGRCDIRRVQERLRLLEQQPVSCAYPDGLRAFHATDPGGNLRRQQPVIRCLHRKLANGRHADDDRG